MKNDCSVKITSRQAKNLLTAAFDNAVLLDRKNCDDYVKLNPADYERRERDLHIELCGINNLYYRALAEIERIEKISRSVSNEVINF